MNRASRWDGYLKEVGRYVESGVLDKTEIIPKLSVEERLREARRAVLAGEENCLDVVQKALNSFLIDRFSNTGLRNWFQERPGEAQEALRSFWAEAEDARLSAADRIRALARVVPKSLPSGKQAPPSGTGTRLRWMSS